VKGDVVLFNILPQAPKYSPGNWPLINIAVQFVVLLFFCLAFSSILLLVWFTQINLFHMVCELFCIFIAVSAFVVIWYTYEQNPPVNLLLGVGFLIVACFDILHVYCFPSMRLIPPQYYGLSAWYWLFSRMTEALFICAVTIKALHFRIKKQFLLIGAITLALLLALSIYYNFHLLPALWFEGQGMSLFKIAMELLITLIFIVTLVRLLPRIDDRDIITYRYIFLALLLSIPCGLCFAVSISLAGFTNILGHLLKAVSYYCLFRGIVLSGITYPYLKLQRASDYLSRLLNNLPGGILTYDHNSILTFANQKATEILACDSRELIGLTAKEVVTMFSRVNLGEIGWNPESKRNLIEITNRHGKRVKLKMDMENLQDDGLICLIDEAKMEQEIINLQLQTQTILNSINNLVIMVDKQHRVVMCNTLWEETIETPASLVLGMNIEHLNGLIQLSNKEIPRLTLQGHKLTEEVSLITISGKKLEIRCDSAPILNVDGEIIGAIFICSDITELRKQQRISQQQEKLAVLGEMAAGIVHEIKNPLTTVKGFMQLIAAQTEDDTCREYADLVRAEVDDMNQVVSDFLTFARPRKPVTKETSLNQLVNSIGAFWTNQLAIEGIDLEITLSEEEKLVMLDQRQFRQVLTNMVKNALDAMNSTVKARLSLKVEYDRHNDRMMVTVSDNGVGMTEEELSKLGTPFYSTKDRGTGLGMGICYQIIKEHNGIIWVESKPGEGTTFAISLPVP